MCDVKQRVSAFDGQAVVFILFRPFSRFLHDLLRKNAKVLALQLLAGAGWWASIYRRRSEEASLALIGRGSDVPDQRNLGHFSSSLRVHGRGDLHLLPRVRPHVAGDPRRLC